MNETLATIKRRRSVRTFQPRQISDADIQTVLNAGISAPNGINLQKWHFTVIQNQEILDRMVETIKEGIMAEGNDFLKERAKAPGYHTFYRAPTVILLSGDQAAPFSSLDCACAAENMILAAESLSLASCFIISAAFMFKAKSGAALAAELGIPAGYRHVCSVALGYRQGDPPAPPPRNANVVNYVK